MTEYDVRLRASDRLVFEALQSRGDRLDLVVEPVVGDHPVDVAVELGARPVEIVGDEQDLERATSAGQPGEPCHRAASGDHPRADLELAEQRVLAGGEAPVTASTNSLPAPRARPDSRDADQRRARKPDEEIEPRVHPGRAHTERRGLGRVVLDVVVRQVEVRVGAFEHDDVEVRVLLDQTDELGELRDRRRRDGVDGRVVEPHPAVSGAASVDPEMAPRVGPSGGAGPVTRRQHALPPRCSARRRQRRRPVRCHSGEHPCTPRTSPTSRAGVRPARTRRGVRPSREAGSARSATVSHQSSHVLPGSRSVISCRMKPLPSGSLNVA